MSASPTFRKSSERIFTAGAKFSEPTEDGPQPRTLQARFRVLPIDRTTELARLPNADVETLKAALVDVVTPIPDEHGNALPWGDELRDWLVNQPDVKFGLLGAYIAQVSGQAKRGN